MSSLRVERLFSFALIILLSSCVDRFFYEVDLPQGLPLAVFGHISNQDGPYEVNINTSFDVNSAELTKKPVSVNHVTILDALGNGEELKEVSPGIYQTDPSGLKGKIGGVYKLRIELPDGKIYESIPDTLLAPGKIDSLYDSFYSRVDASGTTRYGFDLMANSTSNSKSTRYMWNFTGTFKALTHPESMNTAKSQCYPINGKCNFLPPCSGMRNIGAVYEGPIFERAEPCSCCTCWYKIFNTAPILSDEIFSKGSYSNIKIYDVPLSEWYFQDKIRTMVTQTTLSLKSFEYFKSIKQQKESVGSLSQPTVGRIPNAFIQISGDPAPINGIFYSAGTHSKSIYITPLDVKGTVPIPKVRYDLGIGLVDCRELFPYSTNVQPSDWIE